MLKAIKDLPPVARRAAILAQLATAEPRTETRGRPELHPWSTTPVGGSFDITCPRSDVRKVRTAASRAGMKHGSTFTVTLTRFGCTVLRTL